MASSKWGAFAGRTREYTSVYVMAIQTIAIWILGAESDTLLLKTESCPICRKR